MALVEQASWMGPRQSTGKPWENPNPKNSQKQIDTTELYCKFQL